MPSTFPEVWLNRVITNLTTSNQAPWLDGIAEIDTEVAEVGSGSASESNIIHIPTSMFEPDVLMNNTTYPIALQAYDDDEVTIQLDKYQTKVTTLSDDQTIGAAYNKIDTITGAHTRSILSKKYAKAIHALAPAANGVSTPVVATTGDGVGATGTRKRLVYEDIVALKDKLDKMECPTDGRRLVLSSEHYNDLLLDRKNFGDQLVNYKAGTPAPIIAGFEIHSYIANPYFKASDGTKFAFGAVPGASDSRASVCFYTGNVAKKTGLTKQYFSLASTDPENQVNKLNYRHYFIVLPMRAKYVGAIYSGVS